MKVLSLFTGAGGLDIGLERAGFKIAGCVEADGACQSTLGANRDWALVEPGDIHAHRPSDILGSLGVARGEIALLAGGPPCQPFSKSGQWKHGAPRRMRDPRADTLRAYLKVLEAALPDAMLLENVKGITATRKHITHKYEGLDVLRSALVKINRRHGTSYSPVALVIDAADYGVPQHRERVFVFAARNGFELTPPDPTHGEIARAANGHGPVALHTTTWDAIGDLDDPDFDPALAPVGRWAELLASIPEGANYQHHTARGDGEPLFGWRTRYWSFLLKLAKARPSWTIQAQAGPATGPFHWRSRRLSTNELKRLQCFPNEWELVGGATSARRQLGNAVPPPIGELLGRAVRHQLLGQQLEPKPPLTPSVRPGCPPPESPAQVPAKFLELRGEHAAHPGTGKGPGALARERSPAP